jgi:hypothetical protein
MKSPSESAFERVVGTPRGDYLNNNLGGVPGGVAARVPGWDLNAFRPADIGSGRELRSQVSQGIPVATPPVAIPGAAPVAAVTAPDPSIRQDLFKQGRALGQSIGEAVRPLIGDREALRPLYSTFQPQVHALRAQWQATEPLNPGGGGRDIDPRFTTLYDRYLRGGG